MKNGKNLSKALRENLLRRKQYAKSEDYIEAEEYAKKRNAGLWQGHFEIPKDFRKRNRGKKK